MHQGQLPRIVQLETGTGLPDGVRVGFASRRKCQPPQVPAIDKRLEDVLLDVEIAVVNRRDLVAQGWQMLDGFYFFP